MEQYKDGNTGFSAHTKLSGKKVKLKSIPGTLESGKYTDPQGDLTYYRNFLAHIMNISPSCAIAKTTGNDFETSRIMITPYDLYEAFRLISRVPMDSPGFRAYSEYLEDLYQRRDNLFPTGDSLLPKYIRYEEIPNPSTDYTTYNQFLNELRSSLRNTLSVAKKEEPSDPERKEQEKEI
ncbi:MAG: hypothetical protein HFJ54_08250 [Clostridia bacterium]|nr:hypothetical protein [Clostridia bacterium]